MGRLCLIDAYSQIYRVFFAIRMLTNPAGEPVNALYGMARLFLQLQEGFPSEWGALVFDLGKCARRTALLPESDDGSDPDGVLGEVFYALTEKERILFRQVWVEKIPYPELAARYGITEGALRTRISRLKKKITAEIRRLVPRLFPVLLLAAAWNIFSAFFTESL